MRGPATSKDSVTLQTGVLGAFGPAARGNLENEGSRAGFVLCVS